MVGPEKSMDQVPGRKEPGHNHVTNTQGHFALGLLAIPAVKGRPVLPLSLTLET